MIDWFSFHEQSNKNGANTWIASSTLDCIISKFVCSSLWSDYNLKGGNSLSLSNVSLKTRPVLSLIRIAHKLTQLHTRFHTGRKRRTHIKWAPIQLSSFTHSHFTIHIQYCQMIFRCVCSFSSILSQSLLLSNFLLILHNSRNLMWTSWEKSVMYLWKQDTKWSVLFTLIFAMFKGHEYFLT